MSTPKKFRRMTFQVDVTVPAVTGESEVSDAINQALDEPPNDWGGWHVGAATITKVQRVNSAYEGQSGE